MKKNILFLIIFLCILAPISAYQSPFFTHYSSKEGLSQNTVMSMLQDRNGNMWFSTWDGINRFDGYNFKTYKARLGNDINLTNNRVDRMYEDKDGYFWLLTYDNRAHRFDPSTEKFEQIPAPQENGSQYNIQNISVLANGNVWLLTESDGAIRVTTSNGGKEYSSAIYSSKSGLLPASKVYKAFMDTTGNEWVLTDNGLAMFKAGQLQPTSFFAETKERYSDPKQGFYVAEELPAEIWFGSDRGRVWRFHKSTGQFELLELPTQSQITSINTINPDTVIIATHKDGIFTYDIAAKKYEHFSPMVYKEMLSAPILSTYVDRRGEVWIEQEVAGTVVHFNPATRTFKREVIEVEPTAADRSRPSFHVHEDVNNNIWVHPYGGGFSRYDEQQNKLVPFHNELGNSDWRFSNKIHSSFSDAQGNLWLSSHSKGLEKVAFRSVQFNLLTPESHIYESLANEVRSLCEDANQNIWVGLKDGRLRVYDKDQNYLGILNSEGKIAKTGNPIKGTVYSIMQDSKGRIWLATKGDGLILAQPKGNDGLSFDITRFNYDENDIYSLSNDNVYSVFEDNNGRIWIGTFANGINYIDTDATGKSIFINHRNNMKGYPIDLGYKSRYITSDNNGHIWVGTTAGAIAFDENFTTPESIQFKLYQRKADEPNSLSNNDVHWITSTADNQLFLATFGGGLNKLVGMNADGNAQFKAYTVSDGLPSDVLLSMREDKNKNLWISTENGISRFMPQTEVFENFDERSITFYVRFSEAASLVTSDNRILFGTSDGIFSFTPDSIRKSDFVPPIVFSKLSLGNQEVIPGQGVVLDEVIDQADRLVLSHEDILVSIQYAALDYTNSQNIQYAYILEGFDKNWTFADKQRTATYTNLPKGKYIFKVKSTNSDGVWVDNVRSLPIEVLPSFWETPFAYFLYVLAVLTIIFVAVYILFTIYRLKHEVNVEQQVSDIKLRFFTNISHELRTPLTLIAGPVEQVLKNSSLPDEARDQLQVVEINTNRMLRLVNQILDFRKIQNNKMRLQVEKVDVVEFVRKVMSSFDALAEGNQIDFVLEVEREPLYLWIDVDKFEKILFNLLSNAFKYTPNGKMIRVYVREDEETVSVGVQDQGVGIAESQRQSLFVRFENMVDRNLFKHARPGIGLSLVKELVEMHQATIKVESKVGEGSCFEIDFHKGKSHYDSRVEFILEDHHGDLSTTIEGVVPEKKIVSETIQSPADDERRKPLMLIVEDNQELRSFLHSLFASTYNIVEAVNGMDGWGKALRFVPDIIISDVMMPEKDGIEMVKELRDDITTSHIPIVLLTAKTAIESQLEALELGADSYITKPFSASYLQARVQNLLDQRAKLQNFYRANLMHHPTAEVLGQAASEQSTPEEEKVPEMSSTDRKFMDKLIELMEKNMDNGDLVVDDLVREIGVSRSVFFKKLKTITGLAPVEFIKEMRINRSIQLIETGEFNMTQISYMVGINDPRYFSKCFKTKKGMTPTEYRDSLFKK